MSPPERDSGFTMIELMVTMVLLGIMMAIAIGGWSSWSKANGQLGQARELQSVLRQAHQRAVTEGQAICVQFTGAHSYSIYRGACDLPGKVQVTGPVATNSSTVTFESPSFGPSATSTGVTFTARGTAWQGTVQVGRTDSSKKYTLSVEELTGRVSLG